MRNAVNWNLVYDLPIGRSRQFGGDMPMILDETLRWMECRHDWRRLQWLPRQYQHRNQQLNVNGNSQRANHYRQLKIVHRSNSHWFGTDPSATPCPTAGVDNGVCAYGQPAAGTFGTAQS